MAEHTTTPTRTTYSGSISFVDVPVIFALVRLGPFTVNLTSEDFTQAVGEASSNAFSGQSQHRRLFGQVDCRIRAVRLLPGCGGDSDFGLTIGLTKPATSGRGR
jgi:hypothetical protein